jgi:dipeptidase
MKIITIKRTTHIMVISVIVLLLSGITAFAGTSIYLGKDTTESGSVIYGGTEDVNQRYSKRFIVHPAESHVAGDMYISPVTGFSWPYPTQTYRYTILADSIYNEGISQESYGSFGMNEKNLTVSVNILANNIKPQIAAPGADPLVSTGLGSADIASVILMQGENARDAVEKIASLIDDYGAADRLSITLGDPDETWFMEILSGHQYAAVKAPDDSIGFAPSLTMLDGVDTYDEEDTIMSPGLLSTATAHGTLRLSMNGLLRTSESYSVTPKTVPGRLYLANYYFKGLAAAQSINLANNPYYVAARPESDHSLYEAMGLLSYHGNKEDTADGRYIANPSGNINAIGNAASVSSNLFERRTEVPDDLALIEWVGMGPTEFSLLIPHYGGLITETYEAYSVDSPVFSEDSYYWVSRQIYNLVDKNSEVAEDVADFLQRYQQALITQQETVDMEMAAIYADDPETVSGKATLLGEMVASEAQGYLKMLLSELESYDALPVKGDFTLSEALNNALPNYTLSQPGSSDGVFHLTANKQQKAVTVTGAGFLPGESITVMIAYAHEPEAQDNDYQSTVTADLSGNFSLTVPYSITAAAPWLGGDSYYAAIGDNVKSVYLYATNVSLNAPIRLNVQKNIPYQLNATIDSRLYIFSSSNTAIATVNQNGLITPLRTGSCSITLKATDGSGLESGLILSVS